MALLNGYMALGSALSANNVLTELAASNGYARQSVALTYDPVGGIMSISGATFGPDVTAAWTAAGYVAVFDASTGGNMVLSFPIPAVTLAVGGSYTVPSSYVTLSGAARAAFVSGGTTQPGTVLGTLTDLLATGLSNATVTSGPASLAYSAAGTLSATSVSTAITFASTIAINCALGSTFSLLATGNFTLNAPTSAVPGQTYRLFITQDGTGSRVMTLGSSQGFKSWGGPPTLSTAAGAIDELSIFYDGTVFWLHPFKAFS